MVGARPAGRPVRKTEVDWRKFGRKNANQGENRKKSIIYKVLGRAGKKRDALRHIVLGQIQYKYNTNTIQIQ